MFSDTLIKKFQSAVEKDYGEKLTQQEATEVLSGLTSYFDLLGKLYYQTKTENNDQK